MFVTVVVAVSILYMVTTLPLFLVLVFELFPNRKFLQQRNEKKRKNSREVVAVA